MPPGIKVTDDIGAANQLGVTGVAFILSPDDVKVERVEVKEQRTPIASHHVHVYGEKPGELRDWYEKVFGARGRRDVPMPSCAPDCRAWG